MELSLRNMNDWVTISCVVLTGLYIHSFIFFFLPIALLLELESCVLQYGLHYKCKTYGPFPLHGTARYGSLLGGFPLGTVPGT